MDALDYHRYLLRRSLLSKVYRQMVLYPMLQKSLAGQVLDVGCGIGDFLAFRRHTTGIDVNPFNVQYCRAKNLDVLLIEDGRYPFPAGVFDGAIMDNVLEHLLDPAPVMQEIRRVLKPGASLIVGVPGTKGFNADPDHAVFYDEHKLTESMSGFGFTKLRVHYAPFFLQSQWLSRQMSQYCVYGVFKKMN